MSEREFDAIVLGGGPAGEVCAGRLADGGLEVALVESHLIGGECSFYACMPSKGLLRPGELLAEARRIPGVREAVTGELDAGAVLRRRDEIVHHLDDSSMEPWLDGKGIALVRGHGRLDGERRVRVGDELLATRRAVVVATGSRAAMPPVEGLGEARPWSNREATTAGQAPARLVILGGGIVGVELAQAWSELGSSVTLVELFDRLLVQEEEFAGELVADALRKRGVDVRLGVEAKRAEALGDAVLLELEEGGAIEADEILVATGRRPVTDDLGLETVGLEPGQPIEVDDSLRVPGHDWLYAIGDVNGRVPLTHMGKYQGRVAADVVLGRDAAITEDGVRSPRVTFTDPQVAAVGYTLDAAREAGLTARAVDASTQGNAGASFYGRDVPGTSRLVVDEERGVIAGATFTGPEVADFLHAATVAVVGEVPLERLAHAVPTFPTRSEVWLKLLEAYGL